MRLLKEGDILELLRYTYAVNPVDMIAAFNQVGVSAESIDDLVELANLHVSGEDVSGFEKNGQIYAFNVKEIARSIPINKKMVMAAPINWVDIARQGNKLYLS